jgi:hypothetical protein
MCDFSRHNKVVDLSHAQASMGARDVEAALARGCGVARRFLWRHGEAISLSDDDFYGVFVHDIATWRFQP